MATESLFPSAPTSHGVPFAVPFVTPRGSFTPGSWKVVRSNRRGWSYEIREPSRDPIAVVYGSEADAKLMASSKALLTSCAELLSVLRPMAHGGRLTPEDMVKVRNAVEVIQGARSTVLLETST